MRMKMNLTDYVDLKNVIVDLDISSKSQALQVAAANLCTTAILQTDVVFNLLKKREDLGSTGIGEGVAVPHTRVPGLDKPIGALVRLKKPVDFDAIDDQPVDVVFVLLTPDQSPVEHLNVLACFSRRLRSPGVLKQMRAARSTQSLYDCLVAETGAPS
jgi:PTS system nitrogen regulatory IIA component